MRTKLLKRCATSALAIGLAFSAFLPAVEVEAATHSLQYSVVRRTIRGDGVRLRREGHSDSEILELMYNGESVNFYEDYYGSDPEYNYMQRIKTGTYGFVNHDHVH